MRETVLKALSVLTASIAVAGCGGGGGTGATPDVVPAATPAAPPSTGNPTAVLSAGASTAASLAALVQGSAISVLEAGSLVGAPIGISGAQPTSGSASCPNGGSYAYTTKLAGTTPASGDTLTLDYSQCAGYTPAAIGGQVVATVTRYAGAGDAGFDIAVSGYSFANAGTSHGPYAYSAHLDIAATGSSTVYTVGDDTVVGAPAVTIGSTSGQIGDGTLHAAFGGGWVAITYTDWSFDIGSGHASAGSVAVQAANGDMAALAVGAGGGYNVTLTVGGHTTTYPVPFPN